MTYSDRLAEHCVKAYKTYLTFGWDAYLKFSNAEQDPMVRLAGTMCVRAAQEARTTMMESEVERLRRLVG